MSIHPVHPQGQPFTWQERLDHADCESDVVGVARDYLATLTSQEYASLPVPLRPSKIVDANDISLYAFDLVRQECRDVGMQHIVHRVAHMMSRASIRLSEITVDERREPGRRSEGNRVNRA
jgi:hypothetical protein